MNITKICKILIRRSVLQACFDGEFHGIGDLFWCKWIEFIIFDWARGALEEHLNSILELWSKLIPFAMEFTQKMAENTRRNHNLIWMVGRTMGNSCSVGVTNFFKALIIDIETWEISRDVVNTRWWQRRVIIIWMQKTCMRFTSLILLSFGGNISHLSMVLHELVECIIGERRLRGATCATLTATEEQMLVICSQ